MVSSEVCAEWLQLKSSSGISQIVWCVMCVCVCGRQTTGATRLTQWAIDHGVDVIDTTQLLHVSHLTGKDGNMAGWSKSRPSCVYARARGWRQRRGHERLWRRAILAHVRLTPPTTQLAMNSTGSPKPDRMWNYCALKKHCAEDKQYWNDFCTSCFRCKLGSSKQGAFQLQAKQDGCVGRVWFPPRARHHHTHAHTHTHTHTHRVHPRHARQSRCIPPAVGSLHCCGMKLNSIGVGRRISRNWGRPN